MILTLAKVGRTKVTVEVYVSEIGGKPTSKVAKKPLGIGRTTLEERHQGINSA